MATVYLAYSSAGIPTLQKHVEDEPVNMLIAYPFWDAFQKIRPTININKLVLDSGAFTVMNSGGTVDLKEYMALCKDSHIQEVFALDDMNSWQGSQKNTLTMWMAGIQAIPTYHIGEPLSYLDWCCEHSPIKKIALSAKIKTRPLWLRKNFTYIWEKFGPIKIHGFAMASRLALETVPFDSVDSSSWATAPGRFGQYCGFTGTQIHLKSKMRRGVSHDLWIEVLEHKKREKFSEFKWRTELAKMKGRY